MQIYFNLTTGPLMWTNQKGLENLCRYLEDLLVHLFLSFDISWATCLIVTWIGITFIAVLLSQLFF